MPKIVPIVEGAGEVNAVPILCTKLLHERQRYDIFIEEPVDAKGRSNITKQNGLERLVNIAWSKPGCSAVLLLVDADNDCPKELAQHFCQRILALGKPRFPVAAVVAKMEYEAWFLASLETIAGKTLQERPGLLAKAQYSGDAETRRGVKEWLSTQYPAGLVYSERLDQATMTRLIDTTLARERSRSFRRMCHAIEQIVDAIDNNKIVVTP